MDFKFACQTISWGDQQHEHFPEVFAEISAAGFTGVEIGYRRIEAIDPFLLQQMLNDSGLTLIASHIGGNLLDRKQANSEWDSLEHVVERLLTLKVPRLLLSGIKYCENIDEFQHVMDSFRHAIEHCKKNGIELLYHNHDWEFKDADCYAFKELLANESSRFCPDVGWFLKGGVGVDGTLDLLKGRIRAVHFKDFSDATDNSRPVFLGDGKAQLAEAAAWLKRNIEEPLWIVAEQDSTESSTAYMANRNADYLKRVFASDC